jgi:hypothetical protein
MSSPSYVATGSTQAVKRARLATDLPHSVCLVAEGWLLVEGTSFSGKA